MARKPKPPMGAVWRILARSPDDSIHMHSADYKWPSGPPPIPRRTIFDELVIDDFLHVEQMDTRHWWILVGGVFHVDVTKDRKGKLLVSFWEDRRGGVSGNVEGRARAEEPMPATGSPERK